MRQAIFKIAVLGFLFGVFLCATASALAEPVAQNTAIQSGLASTAHFGFAVIDQSSTGFDKVQGSMVFLDVTQRLLPSWDLGLRTMAQGGEQHGKFYRMGAGPLLGYNLNAHWSIQLSYGFFRETALDANGDKAYHSRGQNLMLGWERHLELTRRLQLLWGGFFIHHRGSIEPTAAIALPGKSRFANIHTNRGQTHGLEVALRMTL